MRKVRLKDIGTFYSGLSGKSKKDFSDGNALLATYRNIFNNPVLNLDIKDTVVIGNGEKQNEVMYGDILFTGSSETPEEAGMSSVVMSEPKEKIYLNSFCFGFRLNNIIEVLPSYMGHLLRSESVRKAISKTAFGVTRFNVNKTFLSEIEIPLPPLSIQREIVSVLDSFTTLIDKMKQEVELRKNQMEYYRIFLINQILTDKVSISSFTKILRGRRLTKNMLSEDYTYPVFHGGNEPIGFYKEANREANSVMIINVGASAGTVGFCNSNFWSSDGCFCLQKNEDVLDKYVYYALKNKEKQIMSMVRNAGIPTLDASAVEKVEIPLPPLSTQRSIVSTLDTFEQYISKLERLITLREKQYAYYREKLLTFE